MIFMLPQHLKAHRRKSTLRKRFLLFFISVYIKPKLEHQAMVGKGKQLYLRYRRKNVIKISPILLSLRESARERSTSLILMFMAIDDYFVPFLLYSYRIVFHLRSCLAFLPAPTLTAMESSRRRRLRKDKLLKRNYFCKAKITTLINNKKKRQKGRLRDEESRKRVNCPRRTLEWNFISPSHRSYGHNLWLHLCRFWGRRKDKPRALLEQGKKKQFYF